MVCGHNMVQHASFTRANKYPDASLWYESDVWLPSVWWRFSVNLQRMSNVQFWVFDANVGLFVHHRVIVYSTMFKTGITGCTTLLLILYILRVYL